ncbi:MAG: FHA domain-containing protein [Polyangia bacterium]|jgi:hypothetical protein
MFLDPIYKALRAPFDFVRAKIFGVSSMKGGIKGDLARMKALGGEVSGEAKGWGAQAQGAAQKAQGASATARTPVVKKQAKNRQAKKMGLFAKKKKCPGCGEKLHASWDQCPYCGSRSDAGAPAPQDQRAAAGGGKARTMAIDLGGGGGGAAVGSSIGWLVPLEGAQVGELLPLKGRSIVGTAGDCDIVLRDSSISSRHAEFIAGSSGFRLNDLGSTNGTYVNDKRVSSHDLVDNDNVRLGRTNFKFKSMT